MSAVHHAAAAPRRRQAVPVSLDEPDVVYADVPGGRSEGGAWRDGAEGARSWSDGRLELRVSREPCDAVAGGDLLVLRARALVPLSVRRCAVVLRVGAVAPPGALGPDLRWRPSVTRMRVGAAAALVVRWRDAEGAHAEIRTVDATTPARVEWRDGAVLLTVTIDAAAMHPRWRFDGAVRSVAAPRWEPGREIAVRLLARRLTAGEGPRPPAAVASRFPNGAEAAFTITDHCDFDSIGRLALFLDGDRGRRGWLGRGLRLTKGVFAARSRPPRADPVPTLEDAEYLALVRRLHADGSEIAPHALTETGTLEPAEFRAALDHVAAAFAPRTWIDHGLTIRYCYTMGGADDPRYALLEALSGAGVGALWSYHDVPASAAASLDMIAPHGRDLGAGARRAMAHLAGGRPLVAAYYARSALLSRLRGRASDVLGRALSLARDGYLALRAGSPGAAASAARRALPAIARAATGRRDGPSEPHDRRELLECAAVAYGERGVPLAQAGPGEPVLFATQEVQHTRDAYTPAALERLVDARGLHVGHCYLLNTLPYLAGVFAPGVPERLSVEWHDTLDALERLVAGGRLWNPTMGELATWSRDAQRVSLFPDGAAELLVRHCLPFVVRGFTLLLRDELVSGPVSWGGAAPLGQRRWGDWLAVWGDVPTGGVRVRWGAPTP